MKAWNAFQCNIDEGLILTTARRLRELGLQDVGYTQLNLDDCWAEKSRSVNGDLEPGRFSSSHCALLPTHGLYLDDTPENANVCVCGFAVFGILNLDKVRFSSGFNYLTSELRKQGLYV